MHLASASLRRHDSIRARDADRSGSAVDDGDDDNDDDDDVSFVPAGESILLAAMAGLLFITGGGQLSPHTTWQTSALHRFAVCVCDIARATRLCVRWITLISELSRDWWDKRGYEGGTADAGLQGNCCSTFVGQLPCEERWTVLLRALCARLGRKSQSLICEGGWRRSYCLAARTDSGGCPWCGR